MFRLLSKSSAAANAAMMKVVCENIQHEQAKLTCRKSRREEEITSLSGTVTLARLQDFSWSEPVSELKEKAPTTHAVLDALLPSTSTLARSRLKGRKHAKR